MYRVSLCIVVYRCQSGCLRHLRMNPILKLFIIHNPNCSKTISLAIAVYKISLHGTINKSFGSLSDDSIHIHIHVKKVSTNAYCYVYIFSHWLQLWTRDRNIIRIMRAKTILPSYKNNADIDLLKLL